MNICVVALGKIGLPLAVQFASAGHHVVGCDISAEVVRSVNLGTAHFGGEADLDERLAEVVASGALTATTETADAVRGAEVVVVVVPLVVDAAAVPEFSAIDAATTEIGRGLQPGTLVVYETTLPVGTTRNRFAPALAAASGLTVGEDLFVCFSPERVYSGRIFADLARYPKLVGGVDVESADRAVAFYESVLQFDDRADLARPNGVWDLGTAEAAELAKLAETTYRDVNIGFANELARYADTIDVDVYAVIDACNSQPFSHIHQPGIAVGGHCIPVYPKLYMHNDTEATIPRAARILNEDMPSYAVERLERSLGSLQGIAVAVLGVAYRGGVKETAFSGVFPTVTALVAAGADVTVSDPMYSADEIESLGFAPLVDLDTVEAIVIQTDHEEYRWFAPSDYKALRVVVDGRRVSDPERFVGTGVDRIVLGAPA
jgi:nucleotide sugar dehydrogenase